MSTITEIIDLLQELSGMNEINPTSDIFNDVGMVGDDFHEMIEKFTLKYRVDMTDYLWYFHTNEEGCDGVGGFLFPPPYKRVDRIPVTPAMLAEFADKGKWDIRYPAHKIPAKRYDLLVNQIVIGLFLVVVIMVSIIKLIRKV